MILFTQESQEIIKKIIMGKASSNEVSTWLTKTKKLSSHQKTAFFEVIENNPYLAFLQNAADVCVVNTNNNNNKLDELSAENLIINVKEKYNSRLDNNLRINEIIKRAVESFYKNYHIAKKIKNSQEDLIKTLYNKFKSLDELTSEQMLQNPQNTIDLIKLNLENEFQFSKKSIGINLLNRKIELTEYQLRLVESRVTSNIYTSWLVSRPKGPSRPPKKHELQNKIKQEIKSILVNDSSKNNIKSKKKVRFLSDEVKCGINLGLVNLIPRNTILKTLVL